MNIEGWTSEQRYEWFLKQPCGVNFQTTEAYPLLHAREDGQPIIAMAVYGGTDLRCGCCGAYSMMQRSSYERFSKFFFCMISDCEQFNVLVAA